MLKWFMLQIGFLISVLELTILFSSENVNLLSNSKIKESPFGVFSLIFICKYFWKKNFQSEEIEKLRM